MLEHATLRVLNWTQVKQPGGGLGWTRSIETLDGQPLGFSRVVDDCQGIWFSWLRRIRVEVCETPDASLVMTLTRGWGIFRTWEIHDAEGQHVGCVRAKTVITSELEFIGNFDLARGGILDSSERVLVTLAVAGEGGTELAFAKELTANPFLRMLLIGCVLTLDPTPQA